MPSYTFTRAGREFRIDGPDQLRELVRDRLLAPDDEIQPDGAAGPVRVGDLLDVEEPRGAGAGGDDPWEVWDQDDDEDHELVEQLLRGATPASRGDEPRPEDSGAGPSTGKPRSGRYRLGGGEARRDHLAPDPDATDGAGPGEAWGAREPATPPPRVRIEPPRDRGAPPDSGGEEEPAGELPASFVEFVQQKRAVGKPLEIHDAPEAGVPAQPRPRLVGLLPISVGLVAILVAVSIYGVVRIGAERTYPTEAEVRAGPIGTAGSDATAAEPATDAAVVTPVSPELREIRIRESLPPALRPFRDVQGLQDVLFADLTNAGVRVRSVRAAALVLKPDFAGVPTRPEEVHIEVAFASEDGAALEDDLLRAALVLGHYGADAHLRIQDVLFRADVGEPDPLCYRTRGPELVALYERERPLEGFVAGLEAVLVDVTVVPAAEEAGETPGE